MDASYFKVMDEVMELMRYLFQTDNEFTIPVSGAGRYSSTSLFTTFMNLYIISAAMEMCLANLIEPGDVVVVGISGYAVNAILYRFLLLFYHSALLPRTNCRYFSERIYEMALRYP